MGTMLPPLCLTDSALSHSFLPSLSLFSTPLRRYTRFVTISVAALCSNSSEHTLQSYFGESPSFLPTLGRGFIIINALLWIITAILVIVYLVIQKTTDNSLPEGNLAYELTILLIVIVDFALALFFTAYGFRMLYLQGRSASLLSSRSSSHSRHTLLISTVSTVVISASFLCRVVLFSWRPVTANRIDSVMFRAIGYYAVELIPAFVQLFLLHFIKQKNFRSSQFISNLYDGYADQASPVRAEGSDS